MNGNQIEKILELIDGNVAITHDEATKYIKANQVDIASQLASTGKATVKTAAGDFTLCVEDLEATAA